MRKIITFLCLILIVGFNVSAQVYNFESDADGTTPPGGVTPMIGMVKVLNATTGTPVFGKVMSPLSVGASPSNSIFAAKMNNFPATANYSVTWKFVYTDVTYGCKMGFLLRASATDVVPTTNTGGYVGLNYGYLFVANATNGLARIYKVAADGLSSLLNLGVADITCGVNTPRWYRASVKGTTLTFDKSTDGVTFTNMATITDATYSAAGYTMAAGGLGNPVSVYYDDVTFTPLTNTGISSPAANQINAYVVNGKLIVTGVDSYSVFNVQGAKVAEVTSNTDHKTVSLNTGIYIVKSGKSAQKIIVK